MASPYSILASVESSNLPTREKSSIRRWVEDVTGGGLARAGDMGHAGMHAVRASGESLIVGGLLGAAHAELKTGLDMKKVPVDAVLGLVGMATSVMTAGDADGIGVDARNIGTVGFGVFAFRKGYDLLAEKRMAAGKSIGGTFGPAQAARVAGETGDDFDEHNDNAGYQPNDGIVDGILTSEDEVDGDTEFGEDPILAVARTL